jgi:hypothetical protein
MRWKYYNDVDGSSGTETCSTELDEDTKKGKKLV